MLDSCRGLEVAQIGVGWSLGWLLVGPAELERGDGHRVSEKDVSRIDPSGDPTDPNNPEDAGENL